VQVPTVGEAQLWQGPAHAVMQQTPSAHEPLTHWLPPVHAAPTSSLGTQSGAAQKKPVAQVRSSAHVAAHIRPAHA
jgi:hypothetical protein